MRNGIAICQLLDGECCENIFLKLTVPGSRVANLHFINELNLACQSQVREFSTKPHVSEGGREPRASSGFTFKFSALLISYQPSSLT